MTAFLTTPIEESDEKEISPIEQPNPETDESEENPKEEKEEKGEVI